MIDNVGNEIAAAYGPVPFPWQTSGAAELFAACQAIKLKSENELRLVTDYKDLHAGWRAGPPYGTKSEHQYSELWAMFWSAVDDVGRSEINIEWIPSHLSQVRALDRAVPMA